ncbi:MAG TPA: tetratricopeptide repeat protein [Candidatus Polarisedimenticolia bacterium]|nr:tetratricopeptide repeat protein [Candidatus Polarisedimenticolia bacterium]
MVRRAAAGSAALLLLLAASPAPAEERSTRQLLQAGALAIEEENWRAADARFREAAEIDPRLTQAHYGMALAALGGLDRRGAEKALRTALTLAPNQPELRYALGVVTYAFGDPRAAELDLKAAADADRKLLEARYAVGLAAGQRGDLAGAEEALREALKLQPDFAPAHYQLGAVLARGGNLDDALQELSRAITRDPALREGRPDNALEFAPRAVPAATAAASLGLPIPILRPSLQAAHRKSGPAPAGAAAEIPDWFLYYQMALQMEDAGQWAGSVDMLQKGLQSKDRSESLAVVANRLVDYSPHLHLATAYHQLGNYREAFLHLGIAKNEGNASPDGLRALNVLVQKDRLRPRIALDPLPDRTSDEAITVRGLVVADDPVLRVEVSGRESQLRPVQASEVGDRFPEVDRGTAPRTTPAGVAFEVKGYRLAEGSNLLTIRPFFRNPARDGDVLEARIVRMPPQPPPAATPEPPAPKPGDKTPRKTTPPAKPPSKPPAKPGAAAANPPAAPGDAS